MGNCDNFTLLGDFNSMMIESQMFDFCLLHNLSDLIKEPTCYKNPLNLTSIDDILTNRVNSFQNYIAIETGLSDHHKMVGFSDDMNNYSPISLLSVFSKLAEKIMHARLYAFVIENNIIFKSQYGFQKNMSTLHSLIDITEQIRNTIENKKYGCGVFIDLKKAFDTINHDILLKKMEHYGIRGKSLDWFSSYLINRSQFVSIHNIHYDVKNISCGVPQGSVLGPLLFLIYINDLPNISDKLKFFLFADDTNIYYEANDLDSIQRVMNDEFKKLQDWLITNRLALNISKTNFTIFSAPKNPLKILHFL